MEDDEPLTQTERYRAADHIINLIGCGRYNLDRKDSALISDLFLVIERMSYRMGQMKEELEYSIEEAKSRVNRLESSCDDLESRIRSLEDK